MDSCSLFLLLSLLLGGYDLYIIAIISPSEPERAAEARRAVVASINEREIRLYYNNPRSTFPVERAV